MAFPPKMTPPAAPYGAPQPAAAPFAPKSRRKPKPGKPSVAAFLQGLTGK